MSTIGVEPAYGRDYASKKAIEEDWKSGKDFLITDISSRWCGKPINREDAKSAGFTHVKVRYAKQRKVTVIKA